MKRKSIQLYQWEYTGTTLEVHRYINYFQFQHLLKVYSEGKRSYPTLPSMQVYNFQDTMDFPLLDTIK